MTPLYTKMLRKEKKEALLPNEARSLKVTEAGLKGHRATKERKTHMSPTFGGRSVP